MEIEHYSLNAVHLLLHSECVCVCVCMSEEEDAEICHPNPVSKPARNREYRIQFCRVMLCNVSIDLSNLSM